MKLYGRLILNSPVYIGGDTSDSFGYAPPIRAGRQDIGSPKGPTGPVEVSNTQIFNTSINGNLSLNEDPSSIFSKVIDR